MTRALASDWHENVQRKWIDVMYHPDGPANPEPHAVRADVGWNWERIWFWCRTAGRFGPNFGPCYAWSIVVNDSDRIARPCGMLTVVPTFMSEVAKVNRERIFAWYLAAAPSEAYAQWQIPGLARATVALLDCAAQTGFDLMRDGEMLLHADSAGGEKLRQFYAQQGFVALGAGDGAVSPLRRMAGHPVEEYFVRAAGETVARCAKLEPLR